MELYLEKIGKDKRYFVLNLLKEAAIRISAMQINHWQYWLNPPQEKIDRIDEGLKLGEFHYIKDQSSTVLGMIRIMEEDLQYWGEQQEKAYYIHSLVIRPDFKAKGIGKAVISQILNKAKHKGFKYVRLDADNNNKKLCDYYLAQGFKKFGISKQHIATYLLMQKKV